MVIKLRQYFLTGLAVLLPVFLTGYIIFLIFNFAEALTGKYLNDYLLRNYHFFIPGLGLLLTLIIIVFIGFLSSHFFGKRIFPFFESLFLRIPLVHQLYPSIKKIISFFFSQDKKLFKQVVLIEFPRKGLWSVAFVTNEAMPLINKGLGKEFLNVFVPTTPGPLTGYFVLVAKEEAVFLDISIEDALKIIISGGVLNP